MKRLIFILPVLVFAAVVIAFAGGLQRDPSQIPSTLIDRPLPVFDLPGLAAGAPGFASTEFRGEPKLLNVFASWCVACREEHPLLVEFARTKMLPIYGLNYKDDRADGLKWLANFGNPYEASLYDRDGRVGIDFGVYGVPESFLIDAKGVIRYKQIGPFTPEAIQTRLIPLVKQLQKEAKT